MDLITTWEVDWPGRGALLVEAGEGGDQDNTRASNLGVHVVGVIHEREESTRESKSGRKLFGAVGSKVLGVLIELSSM